MREKGGKRETKSRVDWSVRCQDALVPAWSRMALTVRSASSTVLSGVAGGGKAMPAASLGAGAGAASRRMRMTGRRAKLAKEGAFSSGTREKLADRPSRAVFLCERGGQEVRQRE